MPGPDQKIGTVLIPEHGLKLSPEFIEQSVVSPDFSRVFAHLIAKADDRGILIRATSDGSLHVVSAGVPYEEYIVASGTALDDYDALHNKQGVWLPDKTLPVGMHCIEFIHYGVRIHNREDGDDCKYEITCYS
ncbi:MAG: hypothetical protein GH151_04160 [Bacteroidetes bacterium]|nr:hypothetical protein [Bacteroidota bacterium]